MEKITFNKYVSILKTRGLPLGPAETAGEETTKGGKPWGESQVGFFLVQEGFFLCDAGFFRLKARWDFFRPGGIF